MKQLPTTDILGISVTHATGEQILEYVLDVLTHTKEKLFISTPNPEMVAASVKKPHLKQLLNQAQISLADGVGLQWAAKWLKQPVPPRTTGADFMGMLCRAVSDRPITVGFLGGRRGVAIKASNRLKQKFPSLRVSFTTHDLGELSSDAVSSMQNTVSSKHEKKPILNTVYSIPHTDILFVAFGFPKQEEWIAEYLPHLPIRVAMSVGGSFDYIAGEVSRAPKFLRSIGLEWLYRLIRQPWRWKRQLALISFVGLVFKEKVRA